MKKTLFGILAITAAATACVSLVACGNSFSSNGSVGYREFVNLKENETLVIGNQKFANVHDSDTENYHITYKLTATYTLKKSGEGYFVGGDIFGVQKVNYNGVDYWWETATTSDEYLVGTKTVDTYTAYSYLVYSQNESIAVKTTTKVVTTCSYKSQWKEFDAPETSYSLGGHFESMEELEELCPELYAIRPAENKTKQRFYIDGTVPDTYDTEIQTYNNYYYFEKV